LFLSQIIKNFNIINKKLKMEKQNNEKLIIKKSKEEIGEKIKRTFNTFFTQLKSGCFRRRCYNPFCMKSGSKYFYNFI